jgi:hypothetical protein
MIYELEKKVLIDYIYFRDAKTVMGKIFDIIFFRLGWK